MSEDKIITGFITAVGKENVIIDKIALEGAEKTNYRTSEIIRGIVKPANVEELQECIKIANTQKIPVYPVSKGKNWGYGSRVPLKDKSVLIDLSGLNRILDYNEELAYVTVEPGVTFQQLFDFLRERKSGLLISTTGGSSESSIIGNALERGIGTGLYADRFSTVCGLEVVLPDGDIIATGFERFGDNVAGKVYKWGMGPSLDSLFSQSNFGIVTKMTMWLMPSPEHFQLIFYKVSSDAKLVQLAERLREMALSGLIRPTFTLYNDFRTFSTMIQYPWAQCTPGVSSSDDVIKTIRTTTPLGPLVGMWSGELSIRAVNKEHSRIQYELIESRIKDLVDDITLVEITKDEILSTLSEHYNGGFKGHGADLVKSFLIRKYIGIPDNTAIRQTYWRKRTPIPADLDPDKDKCGMVWICPIVPFTSHDVDKVIRIIKTTVEKYFFEPAISLQCMSERAINIIGSINWDREIAEEDQLAEDCYKEINRLLTENGYFSYRNSTLGMKLKNDGSHKNDSYDKLLDKIKTALDPNDVLSPGRYNIN